MKINSIFSYKSLSRRPALAKIARNIGWLSFYRALRLVGGITIGIWLARYLGPEKFGLLSYTTAIVGMFSALSALGLSKVVVAELVKDSDRAPEILGTTALLQLASASLFYGVIIVIASTSRSDHTTALTLSAIIGATIFFKFTEVSLLWFESRVESKLVVITQGSVFVFFLAINATLILKAASLKMFAWAVLAESALMAAFLMMILELQGIRIKSLNASLKRAKDLLHAGWPLFLSGAAVIIYMKTDQIMLAHMIGDGAVGIYSAALKLSEFWYFFPTIIAVSVFPAIVNAKNDDEAKYNLIFRNLFRLVLVFSLPLSILISMNSNFIVALLYGDSYAAAAKVLSIHVWTIPLVAIGVLSGNWFLAENRQQHVLYITVMAAVLNVIMNIVLIPSYGENGAAFATLISYGISNILWPFVFPETRPLARLITNVVLPGKQ